MSIIIVKTDSFRKTGILLHIETQNTKTTHVYNNYLLIYYYRTISAQTT